VYSLKDAVEVSYWECFDCGNGKILDNMDKCPVCSCQERKSSYILKGCPVCNGKKDKE
jgi:hypothetical protein